MSQRGESYNSQCLEIAPDLTAGSFFYRFEISPPFYRKNLKLATEACFDLGYKRFEHEYLRNEVVEIQRNFKQSICT